MAVPYHVMARDTTIAKLDNPLFELYYKLSLFEVKSSIAFK